MNSSLPKLALALGLALAWPLTMHAQHGHLEAGALGTNQNAQLYFANGADFVAESGYVKTLLYTNAGRYAGYYQGSITPAALPATEDHAGPDPNAAAPGSYLNLRMTSVEGPAGGSFAFWEANATIPTISLANGEVGTNNTRLTESTGQPGSDPYGHIHGRRFTATKPGIYKVGFQLFDTSSNGTAGGPIHTPSDLLPIYFQAGVCISSMTPTQGMRRIMYGSMANQNFTLESSTNISDAASWRTVGVPKPGNDLFQSLTDTNAGMLQRYYRIKITDP